MKTGLNFLSQISDLDIDWLLTAGTTQQIAAGGKILRKGRMARELYIVLEGEVRVYDPDINQEFSRLSAGQLLGEVSFIDQRAASANVDALTDVTLYRIPEDKVREKLNRDPIFAGRFFKLIAGFLSFRLRRITQKEDDAADVAVETQANEGLAEARLGRLMRRLLPDDVVQITGNDLTIEDVVKVASQETKVAVSDGARKRLEFSRAVVTRLAESPTPVYGLN
ncbi:MAG: cyclic nucleotide-binding domain-containing protein, partial [Methyloligellaceae bacterium]